MRQVQISPSGHMSNNAEETVRFGHELAQSLRGGDMVLLRGEIGAGKSVLARGIGEALGVSGWRGSPTFTLVNEYSTSPRLVHVDLYRLSAPDLGDIGLDEYADPETVLVIEWADRAAWFLGNLAEREPIWIDVVIRGADLRELVIHPRSRAEPAFAGESAA